MPVCTGAAGKGLPLRPRLEDEEPTGSWQQVSWRDALPGNDRMAMTVCRERWGEVLFEAEACRHCGIPNLDESRRPAGIGRCLFLFIGAAVPCSLRNPS